MIQREYKDWSQASESELLQGYEEMADDTVREQEALEWCEAHIGETLVKEEVEFCHLR